MDAIKTKPLGRGLASLLGVEEDHTLDPALKIEEVPLETLISGKYQPRQRMDEEALNALASSVKEKGVLQPILVRPVQHATALYEIIAGERRWQAAQRAGLEQIPVIIKEMSDQEALETALIENIQRNDLTPLEEAEGYHRLMREFNYTQENLAQVLGKSRSHLANMLRLLSLPETVKSYIQQGKLSAGHGRALIGHPSAEALAIKMIKEGLSVRQAENLVQAPRKTARMEKKATIYDEDCQLLEESIAKACGVKSELSLGKNKYKLTLICETMEDLDAVIQKLCH